MRKLILSVVFVSACAPKFVATPAVTAPKYPDFVAPIIPSALANTAASSGQDRGWAFLQAGDLKNAERVFSAVLSLAPDFFPAEVSLGYVQLARRDFKSALSYFDRSLQRYPGDLAAIVGRGQTLIGLGREGEAVVAFESALAANPSLTEIARRIDVLKFRRQEQNLARARQAARAGQFDDAIRAYSAAIADSPDSPFLYRELGELERQKGDADAALGHLRTAVALDPGDVRSRIEIAQILDGRNDLGGATQAYSDALALEPNAEVAARLEAVRARAELARLPEDYRAIDQAAEITRGDLAALIGVRLSLLLPPPERRDSVLVSDVNNHWASPWIISVARAGVMEPFANHAFEPRTVVRRVDLAQAVSRLLERIAARNRNQAKLWESVRLKFTDLSTGHLAYVAASQAVAAGVMKAGSDNAFQPAMPVTGAEAVEAMSRLEALAGVRTAVKVPK